MTDGVDPYAAPGDGDSIVVQPASASALSGSTAPSGNSVPSGIRAASPRRVVRMLCPFTFTGKSE
jgi:hypothetical protein